LAFGFSDHVDLGGIVQFDIEINQEPAGRIVFQLYDRKYPYFFNDLPNRSIRRPLPLLGG
jgi:hypothetical protein